MGLAEGVGGTRWEQGQLWAICPYWKGLPPGGTRELPKIGNHVAWEAVTGSTASVVWAEPRSAQLQA